jgi:putative aminopeptidase FrvX
MNLRCRFFLIGAIFLVLFWPLMGQDEVTSKDIEELFFIPCPTGYEDQMAEKIIQRLPDKNGISRGLLGNVYFSVDGSLPCLSIVCGMDEIGYIVGGIDSQGYLTLDRVVSAPHPLFDSFFPGHPMQVWTEDGTIQAVMALPSLHIFPRAERENFHDYFTLEKMKLDIGASSREQALDQGIVNCAPVTPGKKISHLADGKTAGYSMGRKACAALVLKLAENTFSDGNQGKINFAWLAQIQMASRGSRPRASMGGVRAQKYLDSSQNIIIDIFPTDFLYKQEVQIGKGPVIIMNGESETKTALWIVRNAKEQGIPIQRAEIRGSLLYNAFLKENEDFAGLFLPVRFSSSPSEVIDLKDLEAMYKLMASVVSERKSP